MKLRTRPSILNVLLLSNIVTVSLVDAVKLLHPLVDLPLSSSPWDIDGYNNLLKSHSSGRSSSPRKLQEDNNVDCRENPFMWKISNKETGKLTGIGIGTFHLPPSLITNEDSWMSITNALRDVCTVYGEYNPFDRVEYDKLLGPTGCMTVLNENEATILDIPEGEVRNAFVAKAEAVATEMYASLPGLDEATISALAAATAANFTKEPLISVFLHTVSLRTSPEYVEYYNSNILNPNIVQLLEPIDLVIQRSGRPSAGLETAEAQCNGLKSVTITKEDIAANLTKYSTMLMKALEDESLSDQINAYRCGNAKNFEDVYLGALEGSEGFLTDEITVDRNVLMAESMAGIMEDSPTLPLFAVGIAHWIVGNGTLEMLLPDHGYSLERVESHGADDLDDLTNEMCGVAGAPGPTDGADGGVSSPPSQETGGSTVSPSANDGGQPDATDAPVAPGEPDSTESTSSASYAKARNGSLLAGTTAILLVLGQLIV